LNLGEVLQCQGKAGGNHYKLRDECG
jgi:hypothetical protein